MNTERILFQADANFDMNTVRGLKRRQPSIDFQSADDAGLRGKSDVEVLGIAADQGRILDEPR